MGAIDQVVSQILNFPFRFSINLNLFHQGTSSSRFLVFDPSDETKVIAQAQKEFESSYPKEGWAEQDPKVLISTVKDVSCDCLLYFAGNRKEFIFVVVF